MPTVKEEITKEPADTGILSDVVKVTIGNRNVAIGDKTYVIDAASYI